MLKWPQMKKLRTLKLYKKELKPEPYLYLYIARRIRIAIAKFRIGNHDLAIEKDRHQNIPADQRLCRLCWSRNKEYVEDEYHVLMVCQFYNDLRNIYLNFSHLPVNLHSFVEILSSREDELLVKLGSFLVNMFKVRKLLMASL